VPVSFGDGTPLQAGHVTQPGGAGTPFLVNATHTYTQTGTFTVHVRIFKEIQGFGGAMRTATVTAAGGGGNARFEGNNPHVLQASGRGATLMAVPSAASATTLQNGSALQSGPSSGADDLYWQRLVREEENSDPNSWVSNDLALALGDLGSGTRASRS